jgi:hypothetical protein
MNINIYIMSSTIKDSKKYIYDLYEKSSYLDINSPFIITFFVLILFLIFFISYIQVVINAVPIKEDWENHRCNPTVMPFAGLINKPNDKSMLEFTSDNYNHCMKNIVKSVSDYQFTPFYYILSNITDLFSNFLIIIQSIRKIIDFIREQFKLFTLFIFLKILNVNISFQKLLNNLLNINGKFLSIFKTGAYTLNTGMYLSKSVTGVVLKGILNIIIAVGVTIQIMLATFLYIPAAILSIPYLVFSVGYAINAQLLTNVLRIKLK